MYTNCLKLIIIISISLFVTISCSDLLSVEKENKTNDPQLLSESQILSESQKKLRDKLEETTNLLKEVVKDPVVMKEIEFAIRYNTDELKRDERVDFKELFSKNSAYKKALSRQNAQEDITNSFAETFREKTNVLRKQKTSFNSQEDWESFLENKNITVYWPYSEYWDENVGTPTLTFDPLDNEHRNEGFKPSNNGKGTTSWDTVMVDDQYAQKNQTLIVKPNYVEPCYTCDGGGGGGDTGDDDGLDNTFQKSVEEDQNTTAQVHLGYIQLTEQLDGLYRGGTDLRFIFIDVVEIEPGTIQAQRVYLKEDLTRPDVSNARWKELNYLADHRWHSYQKTLPFHVYDHDGGGSTTINISSEIKITDGTTVNINSEYEVSDKRDDVGKVFFDRDVFLNQNTDSGINGIKDGFRIYGFNNFKATTPHQIINLN